MMAASSCEGGEGGAQGERWAGVGLGGLVAEVSLVMRHYEYRIHNSVVVVVVALPPAPHAARPTRPYHRTHHACSSHIIAHLYLSSHRNVGDMQVVQQHVAHCPACSPFTDLLFRPTFPSQM